MYKEQSMDHIVISNETREKEALTERNKHTHENYHSVDVISEREKEALVEREKQKVKLII